MNFLMVKWDIFLDRKLRFVPHRSSWPRHRPASLRCRRRHSCRWWPMRSQVAIHLNDRRGRFRNDLFDVGVASVDVVKSIFVFG
jgi:hypothetical protein